MKARISRETLLLFGMEPETERKIAAFAEKMNIRPLLLSRNAWNQKVGALLNLPGYERTAEEVPPETEIREFMGFYGFTNSRLHAFLDKYKAQNLPFIPMKAAVTEYNRDWKLCDLLTELEQEHEMFRRYEELQALLKRAEAAGKTDHPAVIKAREVLRDPEKMTRESLDASIAELGSFPL